MENDILVITEYSLARILKNFALRLGMDDVMADVVAQVHVQQSRVPKNWHRWLMGQCASCLKKPHECEFLNPQEKNCIGGATPDDVRSANSLVIEIGKLTECPSKRTEIQHKQSADNEISAGDEHAENQSPMARPGRPRS